jgi:hypothetical protein
MLNDILRNAQYAKALQHQGINHIANLNHYHYQPIPLVNY